MALSSRILKIPLLFLFFAGAVAFWGAGFRGSCLRFFRRQSLAVPLPCNCLTGFSQLRVMLTGVSDKHFVFDKVWENIHAKTLKKKISCVAFSSPASIPAQPGYTVPAALQVPRPAVGPHATSPLLPLGFPRSPLTPLGLCDGARGCEKVNALGEQGWWVNASFL